MHITASKLYDYMQCPHRVWRDIHGPQEEKIKEINPFVQLLWDRGVLYEKKVISKIGDYLDLSKGNLEERFKKTIKALEDKTPLIYQGVLNKDELLGIPDLLMLMPDGKYMPVDIKSGMGREGVDEGSGENGKLKKHYAVQLALYVDALIRLGFENSRQGIIYDIRGEKIVYDLNSIIGKINKISYWELYKDIKNKVGILQSNQADNKPAIAGVCKVCPWYDSCKKWVEESDDPTGLFYVGRSKRDVLNEDLSVFKIDDILSLDLEELMEQKKKDKTYLKGLGQKSLEKIITRANIFRNTKEPVVYNKIDLPNVSHELFFDIEDDPTQEFIYLHGVYERGPKGERFLDFTAKEITREAEKEAWHNFWRYVKSLPKDNFSVYYYAPHEKTTYRKLQKSYPEVISEEELESFFDNPNVIDLYTDIISKNTDWPVGSYSLKALAQYCGFSWRDETPSGALSIQWFNEYINKKDKKILERILIYNEDDCKATMILKDKIQELSDKK
jgi:predicted RecB family nuclease